MRAPSRSTRRAAGCRPPCYPPRSAVGARETAEPASCFTLLWDMYSRCVGLYAAPALRRRRTPSCPRRRCAACSGRSTWRGLRGRRSSSGPGERRADGPVARGRRSGATRRDSSRSALDARARAPRRGAARRRAAGDGAGGRRGARVRSVGIRPRGRSTRAAARAAPRARRRRHRRAGVGASSRRPAASPGAHGRPADAPPARRPPPPSERWRAMAPYPPGGDVLRHRRSTRLPPRCGVAVSDRSAPAANGSRTRFLGSDRQRRAARCHLRPIARAITRASRRPRGTGMRARCPRRRGEDAPR